MPKEYCYLVYYDWGSYGDYSQVELFVTKDYEYAQNYIDKFNAMLDKWSQYYNKLWDEDFSERIGDRFYKLQEINKAQITKVELK
jgi:hypothetical protein